MRYRPFFKKNTSIINNSNSIINNIVLLTKTTYEYDKEKGLCDTIL